MNVYVIIVEEDGKMEGGWKDKTKQKQKKKMPSAGLEHRSPNWEGLTFKIDQNIAYRDNT